MSSSQHRKSQLHPLLDKSIGDFSNINNPTNQHLFDESDTINNNPKYDISTSSSLKTSKRQLHLPDSIEHNSINNNNNKNVANSIANNELLPQMDDIKDNIENENDKETLNNNININNNLDDILEQKMEESLTSKNMNQVDVDIDIDTDNKHFDLVVPGTHSQNLAKLYIFVIIFSLIASMLVSKWGRNKLIYFADKFRLNKFWKRFSTSIYRFFPLIKTDDDINSKIGISSTNNTNIKSNPRKKLHIKDPSEGEKLISKSNTSKIRKKELFAPTLFGGISSILTSSSSQLLHSWLPLRYNWLDWKLLYNTEIDGSSMWTFYEKCNNCGPLILIIKDECGYIFGVFIAQPDLDLNKSAKRFFGGADTFVFQLYPNAHKYEWTKINRFFVYIDLQNTNNSAITIGGGKNPAITLLSNLSKGISQKCDTFNNPILSSKKEFNCINLEVWSLMDYDYN